MMRIIVRQSMRRKVVYKVVSYHQAGLEKYSFKGTCFAASAQRHQRPLYAKDFIFRDNDQDQVKGYGNGFNSLFCRLPAMLEGPLSFHL